MERVESVFCGKKARLFGIFMLLYVLVNASISLRMGLHWDEMLDIDGSNTGEYVAAGRWGLALYRLVFGTGAFPLLGPVVAGLYICLALVWQVDLLHIRGRLVALFFGAIYLSSVQWAYQLEFSHQCDAVALGILLCTAGVACWERRQWWAGCLATMLAIGMYQSLLLYASALLLLSHMAAGGFSVKGLFRPAACLLVACVGYALLRALALQLPGLDPASILFQRRYQFEMSRWSEFPADASGREQLHFLGYYGIRFAKMTLKNMLGVSYAGQWVYASALIPLVGMLLTCRRKGQWARAVALLVLWWLPFCLILPTLSDQGARVSLAEPLVLAGLWGLFLRVTPLRTKSKWLLALFAAFALIKSAYRVADIAVNEAYVFRTNLECVREMHTRASALAEGAGLVNAPIRLVDRAPFDPELTWRRQECIGKRGYIPPQALFRYCRFMHIPNMRYATPQEIERFRAAHNSMPVWPASGSVRREGDVILIRVDASSRN